MSKTYLQFINESNGLIHITHNKKVGDILQSEYADRKLRKAIGRTSQGESETHYVTNITKKDGSTTVVKTHKVTGATEISEEYSFQNFMEQENDEEESERIARIIRRFKNPNAHRIILRGNDDEMKPVSYRGESDRFKPRRTGRLEEIRNSRGSPNWWNFNHLRRVNQFKIQHGEQGQHTSSTDRTSYRHHISDVTTRDGSVVRIKTSRFTGKTTYSNIPEETNTHSETINEIKLFDDPVSVKDVHRMRVKGWLKREYDTANVSLASLVKKTKNISSSTHHRTQVVKKDGRTVTIETDRKTGKTTYS